MEINKDKVNHPAHYTKGIEMWDYAYSQGLDFFEGNIVKYVTRWRRKNGVEDLYKAKEYLDKLIEQELKEDQVWWDQKAKMEATEDDVADMLYGVDNTQ
jgi:hypothetical protein|tara:strand:+ start:77 stop:373 length:297 start_codon:yes stop_codon:yes gene_type:complete